jgi:predicted TIM-barrel fold metal-dependent hydrolase
MTYARGREVHDADSHIFEPPDFYEPYIERSIAGRVPPLYSGSSGFSVADFEKVARLHDEPDFRMAGEENLMQRKLWEAMGAFKKDDRSKAIDLLGFNRQIIYDSFLRLILRELEQGDDMDLLYGLGRAHVRAMVDFCGRDDRLIAAGYVPLADPARSIEAMKFALESGCRAVTMAADCPKSHSPSHAELDPMWAMAAESKVPVIYHLGGGRAISKAFSVTGRRQDVGYAGGDGTFTSTQYLGAPLPLMETLNALIVDGVFERHPQLRVGVIEYGAGWVPGWMRYLDSAMQAYRRSEERLRLLKLKLSDYVRRQIRFAPFHFEDTGWMIQQGSPDVMLFSSDYPHKEGGRDPIARFDASLNDYGISQADRDRFYSGNFDDLMGGSSTPGTVSGRKLPLRI